MPAKNTAGRVVGTTIKGARLTARGGSRAGRWTARHVGFFRHRSGGGDSGMIRLLDLHAVSCAGDTLITMGLAGTIFFNVPVGEARGRVALYLLITMAPFALLAPIVGPLLDRFQHGRRYALATTMLGRAFLAWLISDYLGNVALYPAAFGVLALSRAYGVARSAAVPRLLPPGLGLSEAGARASVFGTLAGAVAAPVGLLAFWIGHAWPLRIASVVFLIGMVVALRLPPKADSEPPETIPRIFTLPSRNSVRVLSGRLVVALLSGSAVLRALYGFLTLFLAFSIRSNDLTTTLFGMHLSQTRALAYAVGALGVGTFVATAIGSRLTIRRPTLVQAGGILVVAVTALAATIQYNLGFVILLCLATSIASGLAKLAVDAAIQEKIPERVRASAFAHSETLLMLAWVLGGAIGLFPFPGRIGIGIAAGGIVLATARALMIAARLRGDRLSGTVEDVTTVRLAAAGEAVDASGPVDADGTVTTEYRDDVRRNLPVAPPGSPVPPDRGGPTVRGGPTGPGGMAGPGGSATTAAMPGPARPGDGGIATQVIPAAGAEKAGTGPAEPAPTRKLPRWRRMFGGSGTPAETRTSGSGNATPTRPVASESGTGPGTTRPMPAEPTSGAPTSGAPTQSLPRGPEDQPGYHLYRPTSAGPSSTGPSDGNDS